MLFSQSRKSSKLAKALALLLLVVGVAGLTGCVSMEEHKRLQTAFDQARAQIAQMENDLRTKQKQIDDLNLRLAELTRLLEAGNGGVAALRQERDLLASELARLKEEMRELIARSGPVALPIDVNRALKELAAQFPDILEFDERLGMIRLKSDLTFALGSTEVSANARAALARVAQILNMDTIARNEIQVVGHTDDVPIRGGGPTATRNPDNWTLSTNRAWAVLDVLRTSGLNKDRGMASGWGEQRPVVPNGANYTGAERNRRVEIYIRGTKVPDGIVVSTGTPRPAGTRPAPSTPPAPARGPGGVEIPR